MAGQLVALMVVKMVDQQDILLVMHLASKKVDLMALKMVAWMEMKKAAGMDRMLGELMDQMMVWMQADEMETMMA